MFSVEIAAFVCSALVLFFLVNAVFCFASCVCCWFVLCNIAGEVFELLIVLNRFDVVCCVIV